VLGLYLLTMSVNLMMVYLSLEIVSIASYIFTLFEKDKKASEGAIKYILFGAVASAIMLYGMSLLYGITGSLVYISPEFSRGLAAVKPVVSTIAIILSLAGFLFKLSLAPFHIWTPDVYQTAPTPIVSFFSIAPKIGVFLVLMRFVESINIDIQYILIFIAIATITVGNFSAIWQQNTKRLLAYSSIAHAGFMLVGIIASSKAGSEAMFFYITTYLFANFAAFYLIDLAESNSSEKNDFSSIELLKGLGLKNPFYGITMVFVMISLAGLPPTIGFIAKLNIFSSLWETAQRSNQTALTTLFIFGLMNTAVALFYYLKIPYYLFFKKANSDSTFKLSLGQKIVLMLFILPLIALMFSPNSLLDLINAL
nr:NADH-quinone oxidoreductase subunit N [Pseudarcicella sp.]